METITINRDTLIEGTKWYWLSNGWFLSSKSDGTHAGTPTDKSTAWLIFAYPAALAATWVGVDGGDTIDIAIIDTAAIVNATGRQWKCYHYVITSRTFTALAEYYLMPGVGLIRIDFRDTRRYGGRVTSRFLLNSYHVE